jgi:hypothetical protein
MGINEVSSLGVALIIAGWKRIWQMMGRRGKISPFKQKNVYWSKFKKG